MHRRTVLSLIFLALFGFGLERSLRASRLPLLSPAAVTTLRDLNPPEAPGSFPTQWINGTNCATEPDFQAYAYNQDLVIIRQSKCAIFEAPFLYLIFGEDKALLMDTGASASEDVYGFVTRIINRWLRINGKSSIDFIVAHTHNHFDHVAGDGQFIGQPNVQQVVGASLGPATQFWGFQDFPNDQPTIDLGNRVIDVIGTPGHQGASVTLYDRQTQLLLTGDIVYPGHLFIFSSIGWGRFQGSLRRLARFASEHPVQWVLGCHVETQATPFMPYAYGTQMQPNEHVLQFPPSKLIEIYQAADAMGSNPQCQIFDEFVIHPVYLCGIFWNG